MADDLVVVRVSFFLYLMFLRSAIKFASAEVLGFTEAIHRLGPFVIPWL